MNFEPRSIAFIFLFVFVAIDPNQKALLHGLQGICELCTVYQDPIPTGGPADELGGRFWEQRSSEPGLQQLGCGECMK